MHDIHSCNQSNNVFSQNFKWFYLKLQLDFYLFIKSARWLRCAFYYVRFIFLSSLQCAFYQVCKVVLSITMYFLFARWFYQFSSTMCFLSSLQGGYSGRDPRKCKVYCCVLLLIFSTGSCVL